MILPDFMIRDWAESGGVDPFDAGCINPASIDLRLGNIIYDMISEEFHEIHDDYTWDMWPHAPILATTMEYIRMPDRLAGTVYLKSSMARQGLDHALAGWIDPGFEGELTLELHAHRRLTITPGQKIVQLVLHEMSQLPHRLYNGRYQNQRGPTRSR